MNAAREIYSYAVCSQRPIISITRQSIALWCLVAAVLLSAFGVICVKDLDRRLYNELGSLQYQRNELQVERGKLLLEQSAMSTHTRIKNIAQTRWHMQAPARNQVVVIRP